MSPLLNYLAQPTDLNATSRTTAVPLMKFISSLDLSESSEVNCLAEQPAQPGSAVLDTELWSK